MANDPLQYDKMVQNAFRGVVREALAEVAEHGLSGRHHFYITFRTDHPGVDIPEYLNAQYPHEMTIVLEHEFWGLEVADDAFAVTLSFNKMNERLSVPLAAVTRFVDPGANFGLQLQATAPDGTPLGPLPGPAGEGKEAPPIGEAEPGERETEPSEKETEARKKKAQPAKKKAQPGEKVVALETFRKP
jgi:hypothetical protein